MMRPWEEELNRVEGRDVHEDCDRARMWRYAYNVAHRSADVLQARVTELRKQIDPPMIFFYGEP